MLRELSCGLENFRHAESSWPGKAMADVSEFGNAAPAQPVGISVLVPAYNEEAAVASVVRELLDVMSRSGSEFEVLVIDDASTDATAENARKAGATVIQHDLNRGYGAALKTGTRSAQFPLVCIIDADGTYPTAMIPEMLAEMNCHDMVVGARTKGVVRIPWVRRPAKWVLNYLANVLSGIRIPDLNSGLRIIRRSLVLDYIDILPDRFSFTTTITLCSLCDGFRVRFLPITYNRRVGQSKIRPIDALSFLILIVRTVTYFRPLRFFLPVSLLLFAGAAIKLSIDIVEYDNIEDTSVMLFLAALQTLFVGMLADGICFVRRRISDRGTSHRTN
jgi:glycosyltransferase involved in cell wall biosynthesis